jgi:hypothetical protein
MIFKPSSTIHSTKPSVMQYLNRALLAGKSTREMLKLMTDVERIPLLKVAQLIKAALAKTPDDSIPILSNIAVANLSYSLNCGAAQHMAMTYPEAFVAALARQYRCVDPKLAYDLQHQIEAVKQLVPAHELETVRRVLEQNRASDPAFDFSYIDQ